MKTQIKTQIGLHQKLMNCASFSNTGMYPNQIGNCWKHTLLSLKTRNFQIESFPILKNHVGQIVGMCYQFVLLHTHYPHWYGCIIWSSIRTSRPVPWTQYFRSMQDCTRMLQQIIPKPTTITIRKHTQPPYYELLHSRPMNRTSRSAQHWQTNCSLVFQTTWNWSIT